MQRNQDRSLAIAINGTGVILNDAEFIAQFDFGQQFEGKNTTGTDLSMMSTGALILEAL